MNMRSKQAHTGLIFSPASCGFAPAILTTNGERVASFPHHYADLAAELVRHFNNSRLDDGTTD